MKPQTIENPTNSTSENSHLYDYLSIIILIIGLGLFYYLKINIWFKWLIVFLSLIISLLTFFFISSTGLRLHSYIKDSWIELGKVVWPTRKEAAQFTWVIFIIVFILGIILWVFDSILSWLFYHVFL